jgi:peptidoglycan/LPS O-acetylase OafA/YrhL
LAARDSSDAISFRANPEYSHTFAGRPRIEALTGIRWFAALVVFLSHFPLSGRLHAFCLNGYMGVTVFFVLSGFILTVTYQESLTQPTASSIYNFAVARLARVYPVYLLVLGYLLLVDRMNGKSLDSWWLHVLALQPWSGNIVTAYKFNGPAWSIGVEFFLYACFPLIVFGFSPWLTSARASLAFAAVVASMMGLILFYFHLRGLDALPRFDPRSAYRWIYQTPLLRLGDFLLGFASAQLYLSARSARQRGPGRRRLTVAAEITLLAAVVTMMSSARLLDTAGSYDVFYAIPATILLYLVATNPTVGFGWLLSFPLIVALGEASYAFYLIHVPVGHSIGLDGYVNGGTPTALLVYAARIGIVALLAWGIHVSIERPARRWLRRSVSVPTPTR